MQNYWLSELWAVEVMGCRNNATHPIKQHIQDVKLGLWILPDCSILHHLPHTPGCSSHCDSPVDQPASPLLILAPKFLLLAPNFFLLGANWILGQKSYLRPVITNITLIA